ncbi:MAG: hypothetical protein HOP29_09940 [Phycisphaerales bacterium]|nr:hypothetical protein [Phycisphaerales bacterium]
MRKQSVAAIVKALNDESVRYLIAGGLAVVAHGHVRFTADVDLIVALDPDNARRAMKALSSLGYRPRAPVPIDSFADPDVRSAWIRDKGLTVFSLHSPQHPATEVDLFVRMPVDFDAAHRSALRLAVAPGLTAPFLGYDDLVTTKTIAGRPQDLADLERLRAIRDECP